MAAGALQRSPLSGTLFLVCVGAFVQQAALHVRELLGFATGVFADGMATVSRKIEHMRLLRQPLRDAAEIVGGAVERGHKCKVVVLADNASERHPQDAAGVSGDSPIEGRPRGVCVCVSVAARSTSGCSSGTSPATPSPLVRTSSSSRCEPQGSGGPPI